MENFNRAYTALMNAIYFLDEAVLDPATAEAQLREKIYADVRWYEHQKGLSHPLPEDGVEEEEASVHDTAA